MLDSQAKGRNIKTHRETLGFALDRVVQRAGLDAAEHGEIGTDRHFSPRMKAMRRASSRGTDGAFMLIVGALL